MRKIFLFLLCIAGLVDYFTGYGESVVLAGVLFTVGGGVGSVTTQTIDKLPMFIQFTIGTVPQAIRIDLEDEGTIFNLNAAGITGLQNIRMIATPANTYIFQLANGIFLNRQVTFNITNGDAAAFNLLGKTRQIAGGDPVAGPLIWKYQIERALSGGIDIQDFFYASFNNAAAADVFNITYGSRQFKDSDGRTRRIRGYTDSGLSRTELNNELGYYQGLVTTQYNVDNVDGLVKTINFVPAAAQDIYVGRYLTPKTF